MLNLSGLTRSRQLFRVLLKRKPSGNAAQDSRQCVDYVRAENKEEARQAALAKPQHAAFVVASIREHR